MPLFSPSVLFCLAVAQFALGFLEIALVKMSTNNDVYQTPLNSRYASKATREPICHSDQRLTAFNEQAPR